jgi:hypothetical protein
LAHLSRSGLEEKFEMRDEHSRARLSFVAGNRGRVLRAEELLESALRWQRRDFADRTFVRALEHLVEACNEEADLSVIGVRALKSDVLRCLKNLLQFDEMEAVYPSVLSRPIQAPVFITGMRRSGNRYWVASD